MQKVSVIIPVYNVEKYLNKCLDSVLNQTYENVEIIIVEDKSTDDSRRIVKEYQRLCPELKVIYNEENRGLSYCRNKGLEVATGELISFVDSDDVIDDNFLEDIIMGMEIYQTDIGMCGYDTFIHHEKKTKEVIRFNTLDINEQTLGDIKGYCWNKVYKRSLIGDMQFQEGANFEDFAFTYPLLIKAGCVAVVPSKLYHYRRNFNGISLGAKKSPNIGILDIYCSVQVLERNYKLIRQNNKMDAIMKQIEHIEMLNMAFDASFWQTIHLRTKKEIVSLLYYLTNRYFGYFKATDNPLLKRKLRREFLMQFKMLMLFLNKKDACDYLISDDDLLSDVIFLIDRCNAHKCKIKEK